MASPVDKDINELTNAVADLQVVDDVLNDIVSEVSSHQSNDPRAVLETPTADEKSTEESGSVKGLGASAPDTVPAVEPVAPSADETKFSDDDRFRTKVIQFRGKSYRIVTQSVNGPCPLIAAINALSLQGRIRVTTINGSPESITRYDLTQLIASIVTEKPVNMSEADLKHHEFAVTDVLDILPGLGRGLLVNVRFNDVKSFEYTPSIALFDLLNLKLYHTWKVEGEYTESVGDDTYNQVSGRAVENPLLADFLRETGNQITYSGLFAVREAMEDNSLIVLFRNNHFSTVHRRNGQLYVLCTDEGYIGTSVVWETLQNIDGDSEFTDAEFRPINQTSTPETASSETTNSDFELAKKLQEELNRATPPQMLPPNPSNPPSPSRSNTPQDAPRKPTKGGNCILM